MLDVIVSRVHGLVNAKDCRVIWSDGQLYICKSPTDISVFACDEPRKNAGSWKVRVGEAAMRFQPPSCGSCRARVKASAIGQMSAEDIIASVAGIGADA